MKIKNTRIALAILIAFALVLHPFASSGGAVDAPAEKEVLFLKAGTLEGTIVDTTGKPIERARIRVLDKNGATVTKAITDNSGRFILQDLSVGGYTLAIGEKYTLKLVLKEDAETSEIKVVVPDDAASIPAGGFTVTHLMVGGVVVAIIAGVAVAVSDDGDGGGGGRVSP
ncbi:MAG: carboxypeptidase regulatory-like domain-containing protein [Candidatus Hydrogenedentota bacterium]|nr:MAG: carboxypeptidase regulatory-like domain-containing protein [Candidatus Hydrogenedentota bacterium]